MAPYTSPSAAYAHAEEDDRTLISGSTSPRVSFTTMPNPSVTSLGSTWTWDSGLGARPPSRPPLVAYRSHRQQTLLDAQGRSAAAAAAALEDGYEAWTITMQPNKEVVTSGVRVLGFDVQQCYRRYRGRFEPLQDTELSQSDMRAMHLSALSRFHSGSRMRRVGRSLLRCLPLVKAKTYEDDLDARCRQLPNTVKDEINQILLDRTIGSTALAGERTPWTVAMMDVQDHHRFAHPERRKLSRHKVALLKKESDTAYVVPCYLFILHKAPTRPRFTGSTAPRQDAEGRTRMAGAQGREDDDIDRQKVENQARPTMDRERAFSRPVAAEISADRSRSRTRRADTRRESVAHGRSASSSHGHRRRSASRGPGLQETGRIRFAWPESSRASGSRAPSPLRSRSLSRSRSRSWSRSRPRSTWSDTDDTFTSFYNVRAPCPSPSPPPRRRFVLRPSWYPDPTPLPRAPTPPRSYSPPAEVRSFQRDNTAQPWATTARSAWSRWSSSESDGEHWVAPGSRPRQNPFAPCPRSGWCPDLDSWSAPTIAGEDISAGPATPPTASATAATAAAVAATTTAAPSPQQSAWPVPVPAPSPPAASDLSSPSGDAGPPPPPRRARPSLVYTACRLHDPERLVFTLDSVDERTLSPPPRASSSPPLPSRPVHQQQHHNIPCVLCATGNRAASPRHGGAARPEDELQIVRRGVVFSSPDRSFDHAAAEAEGEGHDDDRTEDPRQAGGEDHQEEAGDEL